MMIDRNWWPMIDKWWLESDDWCSDPLNHFLIDGVTAVVINSIQFQSALLWRPLVVNFLSLFCSWLCCCYDLCINFLCSDSFYFSCYFVAAAAFLVEFSDCVVDVMTSLMYLWWSFSDCTDVLEIDGKKWSDFFSSNSVVLSLIYSMIQILISTNCVKSD